MLIINSDHIKQNEILKDIAKMELLAIDYAKRGRKFDHILIEAKSLTEKYLKDTIIGRKAPLELIRSQLSGGHVK